MEVAEAFNGYRLTAGNSDVAGTRWDSDRGQPNGDVCLPQSDASPGSPSWTSAVLENRTLLSNDNDWTQRRPESVWLEYLYSWNPLAAGRGYV